MLWFEKYLFLFFLLLGHKYGLFFLNKNRDLIPVAIQLFADRKENNPVSYTRKLQEFYKCCLKAKSLIISNTMTLGKLLIKCPLKPREDLWKSRGR